MEMALEKLSEEFIQNPVFEMRKLKLKGKVHQVILPTGLKAWLVLDYNEGRKLLADKRLSKDVVKRPDIFEKNQTDISKQRDYSHASMRNMVNMDPPDHTRMRSMLAQSFNFRTIEALRPKIEHAVEEILKGLDEIDGFDVISDFAQILTHEVISDLLGVPETFRGPLRKISLVLCADAPRDVATAALDGMTKMLLEIIQVKKDNLQEDIISDLIKFTYHKKSMTEKELISNALLLFFGAFETTVNMIGNGIVSLVENPEQMQKLRENPELTTGAVEEILRFNSPANLSHYRFTTESIAVCGVDIPKDEFVFIVIASANRDDAKFSDPDVFNIERKATGHLTFGHGIHICIGAALSRIEGEIAFKKLLERYENIQLITPSDKLSRRTSMLHHGFTEIKIKKSNKNKL